MLSSPFLTDYALPILILFLSTLNLGLAVFSLSIFCYMFMSPLLSSPSYTFSFFSILRICMFGKLPYWKAASTLLFKYASNTKIQHFQNTFMNIIDLFLILILLFNEDPVCCSFANTYRNFHWGCSWNGGQFFESRVIKCVSSYRWVHQWLQNQYQWFGEGTR